MATQWENFLNNLGHWQGSFTQLSPTGEQMEDRPSLLILSGLDNDRRARLTLRRFAPGANPTTDAPQDEMVREYQSFGRDVRFFENGAFSQGSIQRSPFSTFGAEFGFVSGDRRMRLVLLFAPDGHPDTFTLIRERRAGSDAPENPPLTLDSLLGTWAGEACTLYPDWRNPEFFPTTLHLQQRDRDTIEQQITFGNGPDAGAIASRAKSSGNRLEFHQGSQPIRVLLLPDGASATFPLTAKLREPFFLEAGWLIAPNHRLRLIRRYSDKGDWMSLTLVTERKMG